MSLTDDRFARKNAAQSRAWDELNETPKKANPRTPHEPAAPKMGICDKCKQEKLLRSYRTRETTAGNGAVSFGTVVRHLCEDCAPKSRREKDAEVPAMPSKDIKKLLRAAKRNLK